MVTHTTNLDSRRGQARNEARLAAYSDVFEKLIASAPPAPAQNASFSGTLRPHLLLRGLSVTERERGEVCSITLRDDGAHSSTISIHVPEIPATGRPRIRSSVFTYASASMTTDIAFGQSEAFKSAALPLLSYARCGGRSLLLIPTECCGVSLQENVSLLRSLVLRIPLEVAGRAARLNSPLYLTAAVFTAMESVDLLSSEASGRSWPAPVRVTSLREARERLTSAFQGLMSRDWSTASIRFVLAPPSDNELPESSFTLTLGRIGTIAAFYQAMRINRELPNSGAAVKRCAELFTGPALTNVAVGLLLQSSASSVVAAELTEVSKIFCTNETQTRPMSQWPRQTTIDWLHALGAEFGITADLSFLLGDSGAGSQLARLPHEEFERICSGLRIKPDIIEHMWRRVRSTVRQTA